MASLDRDGDVYVLNLGDGENRINPASGAVIESLLDEVDAADGPKALVTTATGKFFSNGLDLEWAGDDLERVLQTADALVPVLRRITTMAAPTVAAIPGHAFAGGALLALAHDLRVMRADRGYFCLPEVDLKMGFTPGMAALIWAKLDRVTARDAMILGKRWGGAAAVEARIVDEAVALEEVLPRATALAAELAPKAHKVMHSIKRAMYADAHAGLVPRDEGG
jgi:enoyl-CoA hydratase/carnithine racemase